MHDSNPKYIPWRLVVLPVESTTLAGMGLVIGAVGILGYYE